MTDYPSASAAQRDGLQPDAEVQRTQNGEFPAGMRAERVAEETPAQAAARLAGRPIPESPPSFRRLSFDAENTEEVWGLSRESQESVRDASNVRRFNAVGEQIPFSALHTFVPTYTDAELYALADAARVDPRDLVEYIEGRDIPTEREQRRIARTLPGEPSPAEVWPMTLNVTAQRDRVGPGDSSRAATDSPTPPRMTPEVFHRQAEEHQRERARKTRREAKERLDRLALDLRIDEAAAEAKRIRRNLDAATRREVSPEAASITREARSILDRLRGGIGRTARIGDDGFTRYSD